MKNTRMKISWNFFWNFFKFPKLFLKVFQNFKIYFLIQKFSWNFFFAFRIFWKVFPDIFFNCGFISPAYPPTTPDSRQCPSVKNFDLESKTGVLFVFRYPGMALPGIACAKEPKRTIFRDQSCRIKPKGTQYADFVK